MLKCYCDSCKEETTKKYATMQIKIKGSDKVVNKQLCIVCYDKCIEAINNNLKGTTIAHEVKVVDAKPSFEEKDNELEKRFKETCYGVDTGKICSLFRAGWTISDIAGDMTLHESVVETVVEMYEMYDEVPDTKNCIKPNAYVEGISTITAAQLEMLNNPNGSVKDEEKVIEESAYVKSETIDADKSDKHEQHKFSPKGKPLTGEPEYIDEYCKTLTLRSKPDKIRLMLKDMCSGKYTAKELADLHKLQYQNVLTHHHKYEEFVHLKKL